MPLNGHLQEMVEPSRRGRILSANNLFVNLFGLLAVLIQYVISAEFSVSAPPTAAALRGADRGGDDLSFFSSRRKACCVWRWDCSGRTFYRVTPVGLESLPATGGVLLLPNHISYIDVVVLQLACPRPIRYLVYDEIYQARLLRWGMRLLGHDSRSAPKKRAWPSRRRSTRSARARWSASFPRAR